MFISKCCMSESFDSSFLVFINIHEEGSFSDLHSYESTFELALFIFTAMRDLATDSNMTRLVVAST